MKYSINFTLDKKLNQIYLFFNCEEFGFKINKKTGKKETIRLKYYTGCRIESTKWNKDLQRVGKNNVNQAGQTSSVINRELDHIQKVITDIYEKHIVLKNKISLSELKNELKIELGKSEIKAKDTLFTYFEKYIKDANVSEGRRKHIQVTYNHFKRFLGNDSASFNDIVPETLEAFQKWLESDKDIEGKNTKGKNTITCNLKRLRTFFNYANDKKWTESDPFLKYSIAPEKYGEPIYKSRKGFTF